MAYLKVGSSNHSLTTFPTGHILKIHEWASNTGYSVVSTSLVTDGQGITFTTGAQTSNIVVFLCWRTHLYDIGGSADYYPTANFALYFHSDASTAAASPSGAAITPQKFTGMWIDNNATDRCDVYGDHTATGVHGVSASTQYHIQLCGLASNGIASGLGSGAYAYITNRQGWVMEIQ